MPINKVIERQGADSVPYVVKYPDVRAGICTKCGVIDGNWPGNEQYKLCEHYRGMQLRCSYCPNDDNHQPDEVARRSIMKVYGSPTDPNQIIVVCDEYECESRHQKRFRQNA